MTMSLISLVTIFTILYVPLKPEEIVRIKQWVYPSCFSLFIFSKTSLGDGIEVFGISLSKFWATSSGVILTPSLNSPLEYITWRGIISMLFSIKISLGKSHELSVIKAIFSITNLRY
ncbi:hypothetical protein TCEL_01709 [Thermobrachium celere DSM 8682]|uniref:Uncharacterized protein n=1 Tax=Thermobrachium celere DSM 8682 TaxID=941824 RepID=R7RRA7_9CLOT|nr:hypothetical protein TCEL_01709 [Thermobrachium celere DSM 8682]